MLQSIRIVMIVLCTASLGAGAPPPSTQPASEPSDWQSPTDRVEGENYKVVVEKMHGTAPDSQEIWAFNHLGSQGWEFVSQSKEHTGNSETVITYFRRPAR
jgi:hypothetical protein